MGTKLLQLPHLFPNLMVMWVSWLKMLRAGKWKIKISGVQRKSVLQLAIQATCSQHVLAQKRGLITVPLLLEFRKKFHLPFGQLKNRIH